VRRNETQEVRRKRYLDCSTLLSSALLLLCVPVADCDESNDAACHVYVDVDPNVGVTPISSRVDLGNIQTGGITGQIPFRIDTDTRKVRIRHAASRLYKGDGPDAVHVSPLKFAYGRGIGMHPESATPTGDQDNHVEFINF
jgi:hypothetical protein